MESPVWSTITASLFSGLVAYGISTYFYIRHERRKEKLSVLRGVMGNRHGLTSAGDSETKARFFRYLNEVFAVFHDSRPVLDALQEFKKNEGRAGDNVTQLLREMSRDLKIDTNYLDDGFFDEPFVPGKV